MGEAENKRERLCEIDESSNEFYRREQKIFSQGVMTKLGKNDLLRLLSILEGELEAQDIIISELQTRLEKDDFSQKRYFKHNLSDPFLALLRDNEPLNKNLFEKSDAYCNEIEIEPLHLLEKVVSNFKRQQVKIRHHLALSDAYYKLVNRELIEVTRKLATKAQVSDNVTVGLEKERENLLLQIRVERAKTRKMEVSYKNLLQLVTSERQRFQLIITMLLEEKYGKVSQPLDVDRLSIDELKDNYKEVFFKNKNLEAQVDILKKNESSLKEELEQLEQKLAEMPRIESIVSAESVQTVSANTPQPPENAACQSPASDNSSLSSASQSVVTVKRTPTVVEKKKFIHGGESKQSTLTAKSSLTSSSSTSSCSSKLSTPPGKHRSSEMSLKLSSSGIVSSPTSGAANFALNSPNQPRSANFPTPALPAKNRKSNPSSSFQATRQKFQRFSAPKPSPPSTNKHENQHCNRPMKISSELSCVSSLPSDDPLPLVQSNSKSDFKSTTRKSIDGNGTRKPQPPKPPKHSNSSVKSSQDDIKERGLSTPPLPPKKSNLSKASSVKAPSRSSRDFDQNRSDHQHHSSESIQRNSLPPRTFSSATPPPEHGTGQAPGNQRLAAKRPPSLNANTNNNNARITPRVPASAPPSLSAQHRLFPPQDGGSGQLLSPVTKTVPKSPLESCVFSFK